MSSNVRERAGQRPILSSLLGALGEPQPPDAPGVATQVMQAQLRASAEHFREEIALHERDRSALPSIIQYSYYSLSFNCPFLDFILRLFLNDGPSHALPTYPIPIPHAWTKMKQCLIEVCLCVRVVSAENRERELEHNLGDLQVRYKADVENMARELELMKNKVCLLLCIVARDPTTNTLCSFYFQILHCAPNA